MPAIASRTADQRLRQMKATTSTRARISPGCSSAPVGQPPTRQRLPRKLRQRSCSGSGLSERVATPQDEDQPDTDSGDVCRPACARFVVVRREIGAAFERGNTRTAMAQRYGLRQP